MRTQRRSVALAPFDAANAEGFWCSSDQCDTGRTEAIVMMSLPQICEVTIANSTLACYFPHHQISLTIWLLQCSLHTAAVRYLAITQNAMSCYQPTLPKNSSIRCSLHLCQHKRARDHHRHQTDDIHSSGVGGEATLQLIEIGDF